MPTVRPKIANIYVAMKRAGYIDAGEYHKPTWQLHVYYETGRHCSCLVNCGGDAKPTGKDLEDACKSLRLRLTFDEVMEIPLKE